MRQGVLSHLQRLRMGGQDGAREEEHRTYTFHALVQGLAL